MNKYISCKRCVMDESAAGIYFDADGVCNYCSELEINLSKRIINDESERKLRLNRFISDVKKSRSKNSNYDCIIGISGGVDSSWVLVKAVELGLKPLVIHLDGGWNTELANKNIENLIKALDVDFYRHKIDFDKYKQIMSAFFKSNVFDLELIYDNAMLKFNYEMANKFDVKYILSGSNQNSEGMRIPENWSWFKLDRKNIINISNEFNVSLDSSTIFGIKDYLYNRFFKGVKWTSILDLLDYNKYEVQEILKSKYGYTPYPYKHYESLFTRLYQGYILPNKFGIDKRKLHHSSLIMSRQMTRKEALEDLKNSPYPDNEMLICDINIFLNTMKWSKSEFENYIKAPVAQHTDYKSEYFYWDFFRKIYKIIT